MLGRPSFCGIPFSFMMHHHGNPSFRGEISFYYIHTQKIRQSILLEADSLADQVYNALQSQALKLAHW